jgi:integrase
MISLYIGAFFACQGIFCIEKQGLAMRLGKGGGATSVLMRHMWNLCEKAEVKYFRFHALRHAGASIMDNNNVPIGAIQKILGHENRSTTEIYLHSFGMAEREAISIYELARQKSHIESHTGKEKGVEQIA